MKTMTIATILKFQAIPAHSFNHAHSDPRAPKAYRVIAEGEVIGEVYSTSEESWEKMTSGVRYGMRGYSRSWVAVTLDGKEIKWNPSRQWAAERLIKK